LSDNLPESAIFQIWQNQLIDRADLHTEEGETIKIIYPGRTNDGQGADLLDAVIATSQGLRKGDIEVHVRSNGWQAHRHHKDSSYNRVILHVVMWRNTDPFTSLENGEKIPILALHKYTNVSSSQRTNLRHYLTVSNMPCHHALRNLPISLVTEFLDSAGEERFFAKAAGFQADFKQTETGQSLYQGIMGALGYSRNKIPFLELARRLPLQVLEFVTKSNTGDEEFLAQQQALLLGTAGLLPSQRARQYPKSSTANNWVEKLEKIWASSHSGKVMSESDWHLFKVRPTNSPIRRMAAMSYLILRFREKGLFKTLVNKVRETPIYKGHSELEKVIQVSVSGYQAGNSGFSAASRLGTPTSLGSARAADIAINVLLPFTYAWAKHTSQPELAEKSLEIYRRYPKLRTNTLERHMNKQLGLGASLVNSAQRQQGLIHIYKTRCSQGQCHCCPVVGETHN
jgi:hypothetical protein